MIDVARADAFLAMLPLPEVYRVGGSVRDELLGRPVKDADYVVTGVTLDELERVLDTAGAEVSALELRGGGPQIGVRARVFDIGLVEVCLPRRERSTGVGRHTFEMEVDPKMPLAVDAARRDFTFNALYHNVRGGLAHDPLGIGKRDLNWGTIETTHWESFEEDPLRTLRALRFVSTLNFQLSPSTKQQMMKHAWAVTGLTRKGVSSTALDELCKILMGDQPAAALRLARDTGVLTVLLPELEAMVGYEQKSEYHNRTVDEHTFEAIQAAARLDAPLRVRLALLFHDCGKPATAWTDERGRKHYYARGDTDIDHELEGMQLAEAALFRLNTPRRLRYDVLTLIERHMTQFSTTSKPMKIRELRADLGDEMLRDLLLHKRCDALGKGPGASDALAALDHAVRLLDESIRLGVPRQVTELMIDGNALVKIGLKGWRLGWVQKQLLHEVMATPTLNEREWLLRRAGKLARERGDALTGTRPVGETPAGGRLAGLLSVHTRPLTRWGFHRAGEREAPLQLAASRDQLGPFDQVTLAAGKSAFRLVHLAEPSRLYVVLEDPLGLGEPLLDLLDLVQRHATFAGFREPRLRDDPEYAAPPRRRLGLFVQELLALADRQVEVPGLEVELRDAQGGCVTNPSLLGRCDDALQDRHAAGGPVVLRGRRERVRVGDCSCCCVLHLRLPWLCGYDSVTVTDPWGS